MTDREQREGEEHRRNLREQRGLRFRTILLSLIEELASHLEVKWSDLDEKYSDLLKEFIENKEHGVAFESLREFVQDKHIVLSLEQQRKIDELAHLMKMT
jgi:hypothetical protein